MKFSVSSSLSYEVSGPSTVLCSLCCVQSPGQQVFSESLTTSRAVTREDLSMGLSANRFTRFQIGENGFFTIYYNALVESNHQIKPETEIRAESVPSLPAEVIPFLFPSRYAPSDRLREVSFDLFGQYNTAYDKAIAIESWLAEKVSYASGVSDENTWALDTLERREGICRDFAHLGIAFCRALTIPARYVTVYAHLLEPQDFHAVFEAYLDGIWYVLDGTRKVPLNGMVRIASGRDASDAAVASLFGNITGTGVNVQMSLANDSNQQFVPLYRDQLRSAGNTLYLA
jgi:transglutaminase-like putative cysteine protease